MGRILIVSNRLPVSVIRVDDQLTFKRSVGGVATGLSSLDSPVETHWIGWPGIASDRLSDADRDQIDGRMAEENCSTVHLSEDVVRRYYLGFSNTTIWPLFHYFAQHAEYDQRTWQSYLEGNRAFFDEVCRSYQQGDTLWIHDYQLMLLPGMIRAEFPDASIGFFLHIPFPSYEVLRLLPWRHEVLKGMLGADLIGFHEYDYVRHFLSSVNRIAGYEHHLSHISIAHRIVRVDAFPMGINYPLFAECGEHPPVKREIAKLKKQIPAGRKLIISIDRLDYTKGITNRLEAFDLFLTRYPEYQGKVTLVVVAVPSRDEVETYAQLREKLEWLTGRINGVHGTIDWTPISYLYRSLSLEELSALYVMADVALITPLRDGMNLVAKEFVAANSQLEQQGILILSEMAGAANELSEAITINPNSKEEMVTAIRKALEMPQRQRRQKNNLMQKRIKRYTVGRWASDFLESLRTIKTMQSELAMKRLSTEAREQLVESYRTSRNRLFLLDYDGTLIGFFDDPESASPDERLIRIVDQLSSDPNNQVVIISGRDRHTLTRWLGQLNVNMIAEHGAFVRHTGGDWMCRSVQSEDWKDAVRPIMELYMDRTPGSLVEEKSFSLVWHCRRCDPDLARLRMQQLKDALVALTSNMELGVFEGNKIIEVKHIGINKGAASEIWLNGRNWDFVFAAGDDYTDEDMFAVLPEMATSVKLGHGASKAKYQLEGPDALRTLLQELANTSSAAGVTSNASDRPA